MLGGQVPAEAEIALRVVELPDVGTIPPDLSWCRCALQRAIRQPRDQGWLAFEIAARYALVNFFRPVPLLEFEPCRPEQLPVEAPALPTLKSIKNVAVSRLHLRCSPPSCHRACRTHQSGDGCGEPIRCKEG